MGEFLFDIVFRIILEAIFEGIFYLLKQAWFAITGQGSKRQHSLARHQSAKEARRERLERVRQRRRERKR